METSLEITVTGVDDLKRQVLVTQTTDQEDGKLEAERGMVRSGSMASLVGIGSLLHPSSSSMSNSSSHTTPNATPCRNCSPCSTCALGTPVEQLPSSSSILSSSLLSAQS